MNWMLLTAGPYQGKSLPEVFFQDAGHVVHAVERGELQGPLAYRAAEVCRLALRVAVPLDEDEEDDVVVLYFLLPDGNYSGHSVVPRSDPTLAEQERFAVARTENCLDLLMLMRIAPADPQAPMAMVRWLKWATLGDPHAVLARRQCESFFEEPENFVEG